MDQQGEINVERSDCTNEEVLPKTKEQAFQFSREMCQARQRERPGVRLLKM